MESVSSSPMRLVQGDQEQLPKSGNQNRTVEISHPRTRIRGKLKQSKRFPTLQYVAFLGIPYALPPVKELRFQPPQRLPQSSPGQPTPLIQAHNGSHLCVQRNENNEIIGSEDCLYLNVFIPRIPIQILELLPVLVYIHGDDFTTSEINEVYPEYLMRENLIVVVLNYRLGIFGFLNMRTKNCLGNAGLKDQVMALEWVRDNIEQFRGNPNNVTICGHGSGGTCVNLHMLSPLSKGLFHKAIVMTGGVYSPWGYGGHANHVEQFFKNAIFHSKELRPTAVDILKRKNTFELMKLGEDTMTKYVKKLHPRKITSLFKPSVECVREGAFLPDTVEKLMEVAKPVPTLAGITKQGGYKFFSTHEADITKIMKGEIKFVELVRDLIWQNFSWNDPMDVERRFQFFKGMYFPKDWMLDEEENVEGDEENKPTTEEEKQMKEEEQKHCLATLCSDIMFRRFYDNFKFGNLLNKEGPPAYVYEFDYFAGQPILPMQTYKNQPLVNPRDAQHTDDYFFLFDLIRVDKMLDRIARKDQKRVRAEIKRVRINMSSLWSSFCRFGSPKSKARKDAHVNWKPHTEQDPYHLRIGEKLTLKNGRLNEGRWPALNAICQLKPTIPSLPANPQIQKKKCTELQQSQPELGSSSTQALDTECEKFQLSFPKPGPSTSQTPKI